MEIASDKVRRQLGELIDKALAGEDIIVTRYGRKVIALVSYEEYKRLKAKDESVDIWRIGEREQVVAILREVCDEFGDNEWENNLHLADVIEKHLAKHLWTAGRETDE